MSELTCPDSPQQSPAEPSKAWHIGPEAPQWADVLVDLREQVHRHRDIPQELDDSSVKTVASGNGWTISLLFVPHDVAYPKKTGNDTYVRVTAPDGYTFAVVVSKENNADSPARSVLTRMMPALARYFRSNPSPVPLADIIVAPPNQRSGLDCSLVALRAAVEDPWAWLGRGRDTGPVQVREAGRLVGWAPIFTDPDELARLLGSEAPVARAVDWFAAGHPVAFIAEWSDLCERHYEADGWVASGFTANQSRQWLTVARWASRDVAALFRDGGWTAEDAQQTLQAVLRYHSTRGGYSSYLFTDRDFARLVQEQTVEAAVGAIPSVYEDIRDRVRASHAAREQAQQQAARERAERTERAERKATIEREQAQAAHATHAEAEDRARREEAEAVAREQQYIRAHYDAAETWTDFTHVPGDTSTRDDTANASGPSGSAAQAARSAAEQVLRHAAADTFFAEFSTFAQTFFDALPNEYSQGIPPWTDAHPRIADLYMRGLTMSDVQEAFVITTRNRNVLPHKFWAYLSTVLRNRVDQRAV